MARSIEHYTWPESTDDLHKDSKENRQINISMHSLELPFSGTTKSVTSTCSASNAF